jgi:hypothetical protein
MPLPWLAHALPTVLYICALLSVYLAGRAYWPEAPLPGLPVNGGHLFAVALGLQREFVVFTSLPYTEGLAWTLLGIFLWRLRRGPGKRRALHALSLGGLMALLYFVRAQFLVVPMAAAGAWGLQLFLRPRRERATEAALALGLVGVALLLWWLHLRSFLPGAGPMALLRFDQNRTNELLSPLDVLVQSEGPLQLLLDRLSGLPQAFDPLARKGYQTAFYTLPLALPLALALWLRQGWALLRGPERMGRVRDWLDREDAVAWLLLALLSLGGLLSIHLAHKVYNGEWYFHRRQALVCLPAFVCALVALLSAGGLPRTAGVLLLCSTLMDGGRELAGMALHGIRKEAGAADPAPDLRAWLSQHAPLTVALQAHDPQLLAWRTRGVGYHWFCDQTSYADLLKMSDQLGARTLIFRETDTEGWAFRAGLLADLEGWSRLPDSPDGYTILLRQRSG